MVWASTNVGERVKQRDSMTGAEIQIVMHDFVAGDSAKC